MSDKRLDIPNDILLEGNGDSSRESGIDDGCEGSENPETVLMMRKDAGQEEEGCPSITRTSANDQVSEGPPSPSSGGCGCEERRKSVKRETGFDAIESQRNRRKETLLSQKRRRDEILDKIRQLEDSAYSDSETEDEIDFVAAVKQRFGSEGLPGINEECSEELMEVSPSTSKSSRRRKNKRKQIRKRYKQAPCKPMLSEWLLDVPEDFEEKWLGVVCPVGKRCIVVASRGKTKVFSRSDVYMGSYKSLLPGGSSYHYRDSTSSRNKGLTILDCIWSHETETFYVLDLICWNSHSCVNCDTEYRQFFLNSKFSENLELLEPSPLNPFPFKPLAYFPASETSNVILAPVSFSEQVDGVLFIHKEAFYISETNPLCLWILLLQFESVLNIHVTPELLCRQVKPKNLESRDKQLRKFESNVGQMLEID